MMKTLAVTVGKVCLFLGNIILLFFVDTVANSLFLRKKTYRL